MKFVLLPGLDGTGLLFQPLLEALPNDISTLVVSYPPEIAMSYEELCNFVMSQLPKEKFILLGESFSGPVAHQIALRMPENLQSVIFVATFLGNPRPFILRLSTLLSVRRLLAMPIPDFVVKFFLTGLASHKQIVGLCKHSIKQASCDVLSFRLKQIAALAKNHQACNVRAIYIQAVHDILVPKSCVETFKRVYKDVRVYQIEGPHLILQAKPFTCAEIVVNEIRHFA